ncbi:MAG: flagellin, partial [Pseudomonas sp.]|nr:flagellin [Pseudomonas sp.]
DLSSVADAINKETGTTGISARITREGGVELTSDRGDDILLTGFTSATAAIGFSAQTLAFTGDDGAAADESDEIGLAQVVTDGQSFVAVGQLRLESPDTFEVQNFDIIDGALQSASVFSSLNSASEVDVGTAIGAQNALGIISGAIANIDSQRAQLGAVQNRFENTIANLQNIGENASAARSRIRDTDYAAETSELTKNQILQQAGTAILAQANQLPQAVLSLLQQ